MNRLLLKQRAKSVLKSTYWMSFLVTTLVALVSGSVSSVVSMVSSTYEYSNLNTDNQIVESIGFSVPSVSENLLFAVYTIALIFMTLTAIAYNVFLVVPLTVGEKRYFLETRKEKTDFRQLLFPFTKERYKNTVFALFIRNLIVSLWSLLIIPGIWFGYAYIFVPYLLAENPNLDYKKALDISKRITNGNKFSIFIMQLSFIGWFLLGCLVVFGTFFVVPYYEATMAEMYIDLRDSAAEQGIITYGEITENKKEY